MAWIMVEFEVVMGDVFVIGLVLVLWVVVRLFVALVSELEVGLDVLFIDVLLLFLFGLGFFGWWGGVGAFWYGFPGLGGGGGSLRSLLWGGCGVSRVGWGTDAPCASPAPACARRSQHPTRRRAPPLASVKRVAKPMQSPGASSYVPCSLLQGTSRHHMRSATSGAGGGQRNRA